MVVAVVVVWVVAWGGATPTRTSPPPAGKVASPIHDGLDSDIGDGNGNGNNCKWNLDVGALPLIVINMAGVINKTFPTGQKGPSRVD